MSVNTKTKMISRPDWMLYDSEKQMFDVEQQYYMLLAMEHKFNAAIQNNDVTKLYEIVFHFLNINALTSDKKLYDANFREIKGDERLAAFIRNLQEESDGPAGRIISQTTAAYTRIITAYIKFAMELMNGITVTYFNADNIHYYNTEAFVLFNVKPHEEYEMWRIMFRADVTLGSSVTKIASFSGMRIGETADFKAAVKDYNRKNPSARIRMSNFCAAECESAKDSKNVVSVIKDIILLNKIFNDKNQFSRTMLRDIQQVIVDKKTFPFKLLIQ